MKRRSIFAIISGCLSLRAVSAQACKQQNTVYWVMMECDEICICGNRAYLGPRTYRSAALPFANKDEATRWRDILARLSERENIKNKRFLEGLTLGPGVKEAVVSYRVVEELV